MQACKLHAAPAQGVSRCRQDITLKCCTGQRPTFASLCVQEYARLESQIQELRATMKELISHRVEDKDKHHK